MRVPARFAATRALCACRPPGDKPVVVVVVEEEGKFASKTNEMGDSTHQQHSLEVDTIDDAVDGDPSSYDTVDAAHAGKTVKKVLLLVAMEAEAMPMVESLKLKKTTTLIPPPAPCATFVSDDGAICLTYYGKCPNTGMCSVGIEELDRRTDPRPPAHPLAHTLTRSLTR
jgi:hypothetical protein